MSKIRIKVTNNILQGIVDDLEENFANLEHHTLDELHKGIEKINENFSRRNNKQHEYYVKGIDVDRLKVQISMMIKKYKRNLFESTDDDDIICYVKLLNELVDMKQSITTEYEELEVVEILN